MTDQKITLKYILTLIIVVFITWIIHEFAHWLTNESLGYETIMRLNGTSTIKGENPTDLHNIISSSAGPIITIIQGLVAYVLLKFRKWNKCIYAFLFTAFFMRFFASLMNFIMLNDEGRISVYLKLGIFTLPIIVSGILFYMVYKISRKYNLKWKFHILTSVILLIAVTGLIFIDQYFKIRIL
jgi:high-affinity Fe2+/Pb2+ permease